MNINTQPLIQEELPDTKSEDFRADAHNLIDSISDIQLQRGILTFSSGLPSFTQVGMPETVVKEISVGTSSRPAKRSVTEYFFKGKLNHLHGQPVYCSCCGQQMVYNGTTEVDLKHIPMGNIHTHIVVSKQRVLCQNKNCPVSTYTESIDFKAQSHLITDALENYTCDLLRFGLTMKEISIITGLNKNTVKEIDKKRLQELYTVNGEGKELKKPTEYSEYLGIDEFLLHKGHKYATLIMDIKTGHVLYLAYGKKKQTVYDFIDWIGIDWMKNVKAVACDMNSDFEEAFKERCEWLDIVYDHFHLVKNFNDKVVSEVRKEEQKRLIDEGNTEAAKALKGSKYVLMMSAETRNQKEKDAKAEKVIARGSNMFKKPEVKQKAGIEEEYKKLLKENKLFFTIDLVKEQLDKAYKADTERGMKIHINRIIRTCKATENKHFMWFAKLLDNHIEGIISHARVHISSGKVEGTNQMIKTLRRQGYGYPDDEYFFLKIIDASKKFS